MNNSPNLRFAGQPLVRNDARAKVTGKALFGNDLNLANQLYAKTVYCSYPNAIIESIDCSEARALTGMVAVITAQDVPGDPVMFGRFPVLVQNHVKFIGDGIAVVAAETLQAATLAARLVKVTYKQILPPILDIASAKTGSLGKVHEDKADNIIEESQYHLFDGDVDKAFSTASRILQRTYQTGFVDNGYIEPESIIVSHDPNANTLLVQGTTQNPYSVRSAVAGVLGWPLNRVRVIQSAIGGSYGGKDESAMILAARAAILVLKTGRPVKMTMERDESFLASSKRHPFISDYRIGLSESGEILAIQSNHEVLGGPYNKQARYANWRASIHAAGPYRVPNVHTTIEALYSHTIYGGAYRGFSAPQITFAIQSLADECAQIMGMNPHQFQLMNCLKPNDMLPTGQTLHADAFPANLAQLIDAVCEKTSFDKKWQQNKENQHQGEMLSGVGLSVSFRGTGLGGEGIDTGSATLTIDLDGYVQLTSGFSEMGQGISTTLCQIAAEELGIDIRNICWGTTDTAANMDAGPTVASRGLVSGGNAVRNATDQLKKRIVTALSEDLHCPPGEIEFHDDYLWVQKNRSLSFRQAVEICLGKKGISLSCVGWTSLGSHNFDPATGKGDAYPSYLWGATVAEITVDTGLGTLQVKKLTCAVELGKAINPQIVRGQLVGASVQGLGYALTEEMDIHNGYLHTKNFDAYLIPCSVDVPPIDILLFETDDKVGPYGAKGIGEFGVEMIAPAIANAYANATGKRIRELPLNAERIGQTMKDKDTP
ncbi:xanthine dehydrogenase family protein molybdopterin-binding subunit [uncultured Sphaerochaeta sp.]|uniref:xanthine dehydrogenase family protein molybdopterin-binding subunit n=1 Tax=uncultured Sphaerochaeta sp. TaxID=886478 RepID=UPI002A0A1B12|nr:xanthine dehydrogenase family protein molybdopterin-binding subunit [uncultured Sphaerochaeta sp.]